MQPGLGVLITYYNEGLLIQECLKSLLSQPDWAAQRLLPQERRNLAIQVLAGAQPVSDLAREHEVSRKFLYQQAHTAEEALSEAFAPSNSRLRTYFFLRRQLGEDYLTLLQFFLNHRRYLRSEDPSRVGKSPAELLMGEQHAHWLELLGHTRFSWT